MDKQIIFFKKDCNPNFLCQKKAGQIVTTTPAPFWYDALRELVQIVVVPRMWKGRNATKRVCSEGGDNFVVLIDFFYIFLHIPIPFLFFFVIRSTNNCSSVPIKSYYDFFIPFNAKLHNFHHANGIIGDCNKSMSTKNTYHKYKIYLKI